MKAKQLRQMTAMRWIALLLTAALMITFAACGGDGGGDDPSTTRAQVTGGLVDITTLPAAGGDIPAWSMEVRGVPTVNRFTSVDAQYLPKVEVSMTMQNQFGVNVTNKYAGVTLRSILNLFYVPDVVSVAVTSMSGSTVTYPQQLAMHQDTVLAWEIDGVPIDTQHPLRMCPGSGGGTEMFVDGVAAIVVSPADPSMTTTSPAYGQELDAYGNPIPTLSPTYPTYNPNANTYTMPPYKSPTVYTTVQQTDASGNPITTAAPTTARTNLVLTTKAPYKYVGPATAAKTQKTTTTQSTASTKSTNPLDNNLWGNGGGGYPPGTTATTATPTTTTTEPTS